MAMLPEADRNPVLGSQGCCGKIKGAIKLAQSELGIGISASDLTAERRKICEGCPEWDHGKCKVCGCYTYAKTRLTRETCPLGKWPQPENK